MKRWGLVFSVALLLSGCGGLFGLFGDEDSGPQPSPLMEFKPEATVEKRWSASAGSDTRKRFVKFTPAVAGNRVYGADVKGKVGAYDAASGAEVWRTDTDVSLSGGVGLGEDLVLVGSAEAEVIALAATDGKERWRAQVSSEVLAPPQGGRGVVLAQTVDGKLWGLEAADGKRRWVFDTQVPVLSLRGTSSPVLLGDLAVAGFANGKLAVLATENGRLLWERRIAVAHGRTDLDRMVDIDADPLVIEDVVYTVGYRGQLTAIGLRDGSTRWRREISSYTGLGGNAELLFVTDEAGLVWGLERERGEPVWKQEQLRGRQPTAPLAVDSYVVVGDYEGYLHWLDASDGHLVARIQVDEDGLRAAPVALANDLYVLGNSGRLTAVRFPRR
jgi:outer membrane protein assembly factor BamB